MEFFGIGMSELMVVLVIAIVLFGPDKIPTMVGQVTKAIRDFRRYTNELTKEFNEATGGLRDEFTTITNDLKGELAQAQADLRSQLDLTDALRMDDAVPATAAAATMTEPARAESAAPELAKTIDDAPAAPEPTITVTTPYADALAAANGATNGTNGSNGHTDGALALTVPLATKADPLADLTVLTLERATDSAMPEPVAVGAETVPAALAVSDADGNMDAPATVRADAAATEPVIAATGMKPRVGGSVAGSKYARRRKP